MLLPEAPKLTKKKCVSSVVDRAAVYEVDDADAEDAPYDAPYTEVDVDIDILASRQRLRTVFPASD